MYCSQCGTQNFNGEKFCKNCGIILDNNQPQQYVNNNYNNVQLEQSISNNIAVQSQQPIYNQQPVNQINNQQNSSV